MYFSDAIFSFILSLFILLVTYLFSDLKIMLIIIGVVALLKKPMDYFIRKLNLTDKY